MFIFYFGIIKRLIGVMPTLADGPFRYGESRHNPGRR